MASSPYRYTLSRTWDERLPRWTWVLLNPTMADVGKTDQAIAKCVRFTTDGGGGGLFVAYLYAWITPSPDGVLMLPARQSVGPINDYCIRGFALDAQEHGGKIIAAWGAHPRAKHRAAEVLKILREYRQVYCLGLDEGYPCSPLHVPGAVQVVPMPEAK